MCELISVWGLLSQPIAEAPVGAFRFSKCMDTRTHMSFEWEEKLINFRAYASGKEGTVCGQVILEF